MAASFPELAPSSQREAPATAPTLADTSGAAIYLDADGRIRGATTMAAAMLGYEPQQIIGRALRELAAEGWQAAADVAAARVRFGNIESFELALRGRSGRRTLVEMNASRVAGDPIQALVAWSERRSRRPAPTEAEAPAEGRLGYALLQEHERERATIAATLHDELAPMVVMVRLQLEQALASQVGQLPPAFAVSVQEACTHLRQISASLVAASTRLHPRVLEDLGLGAAVESLCREVGESQRDIEVSCRIDVSDADVPAALRLEVFRVIEEALSNVVEHAGARKAVVSLYRAGTELCALVEDDGRGFEPPDGQQAVQQGALGLQAVRWRVAATGGRLLFAPGQVQGTRIGAAWPL